VGNAQGTGSSGRDDAARSEPAPKTIRLTRAAELETRRAEIFGRINARPDIARLMAINPVKALSDVGVEMTPSLASHALHALQMSPDQRARRRALERSLRKRFGESPDPLNPAWLAGAVFGKLHLKPRVTKGHDPAYHPPEIAADLERLQARRPKMRSAPDLGRPRRGVIISVAPWRPAFRRLDLDAPVPELPAARTAPKRLAFVDLWFYKDDDAAARELLELGVVMHTAFPLHSPHSYREVKAGRKRNAFVSWITDVKFPT
jgi:hypothetical protein